MPALYKIVKGTAELLVEHRQLATYQANGWDLFVEKKVYTDLVEGIKSRDLIEVWRGKESRACTVDQLAMMAGLGFEPKKEKTDAGKSGNFDAGRPVDEPVGDREPRDQWTGDRPEVGLAGNPDPEPAAEARLDDEPTAGPVIPTNHFKLDRPSNDKEIQAAFDKLDPANDEHWTRYGQAKLDAVNSFLVHGPTNRPQLNKVTGNAMRPGYTGRIP